VTTDSVKWERVEFAAVIATILSLLSLIVLSFMSGHLGLYIIFLYVISMTSFTTAILASIKRHSLEKDEDMILQKLKGKYKYDERDW